MLTAARDLPASRHSAAPQKPRECVVKGIRAFGLTVIVAALLTGCAQAVQPPSSAARVSDVPPSSPGTPSPSAGASAWAAAVHVLPGAPVQPMVIGPGGDLTSADKRGEAIGWADIAAVNVTPEGQIHWRIEMALPPPAAAALTGAGKVLTYGLVFETTGDGIADYLVGINNDAPKPGDFRVWLTDLTAGETQEQLGAPYGFPIEFAHPNEESGSTMVFTFLGSSAPAGLTARDAARGKMRFYAWTSVTDAGQIVASDYAPDDGWFVVPPRP